MRVCIVEEPFGKAWLSVILVAVLWNVHYDCFMLMAALGPALVERRQGRDRGGEAAPLWSGLSTSNIAALASSVAIVVVAVIFLFTVVVCLYCCYRYRKR